MTLIMLFEFLIGFSDVYVAGRLGKEVQAAYGLAFQMYFIFIFIGLALSVGTVSVISRLFTSEKKDELSVAVYSSLAVSAIAGIVCGVAGFALANPVIGAFNIPERLKSIAIPLLRIYSLGFFFDYILINANAILRSSGMIKKALISMGVACVLNVALNFILALGTPLGFRGIAVATVISLFAGNVVAWRYLGRLIGKMWRISVSVIRKIIIISWPSGALQIVWQISSAVLFFILSALPRNNVETIAAFTNGLKIESAIFLPAFAFNMASAVIVGNLLGKREEEEAFRSGIVTALLGVGVVAAMTCLVMLNARYIASFLSDNGLVVSESVRYIYIALISEPFMAWAVILGGGLNGAGDTRSVMIIITLCVWLVRIPASYILGIYFGFGAIAVWWSMNLSIIVQAIFITRRYFSKRWVRVAGEIVPV